MKKLVFLLFIGILIQGSFQNTYSQLSYGQGGLAVADPGATIDPNFRRYVDAENGDDNNDGKTQSKAWKTIGKVVSEKNNFTPGTHILFKRGQSWTGTLNFSNVNGTAENYCVLGAYGLPLTEKAKLQGEIDLSPCSYLMVREFDCIKISMTSGDANPTSSAHDIIIYDNIVHGKGGTYPSNGIRAWARTYHIAIVGNLVYDVGANDCICIHGDGNFIGPYDGHWVLDNIVIGNSGMEDGLDFALTDYSLYGQIERGDVKVVANRIQMDALSGLSLKTGRGQKCISAGHEGIYFWFVGNIMTGSKHVGFNLNGLKKYTYVNGNISYANAMIDEKNHWEMQWDGSHIDHNTIINTVNYRAVVNVTGENSSFSNNLLIRPIDGQYIVGSVAAKQNNANELSVPGISAPEKTSFNNDPRNWREASFMHNFIPESSWAKANGSSTPGAFDSNGNWLDLEIKPFQGSPLENNGLGWEGPPLVQHRLSELGINFGRSSESTSVNEKYKRNILDEMDLKIFPTPFSTATNIEFNLPKNGFVSLSILNGSGQKINELACGIKSSGPHQFVWNATDQSQQKVPSGIYFLQLSFNENSITKKLILL
jgi:hypothetical protein